MSTDTCGANAPALPTVIERTEIIDGQVVRVESGFDFAPETARLMSAYDGLLRAEKALREANAEAFHGSVRIHSFG